jgi:hypothetical protein
MSGFFVGRRVEVRESGDWFNHLGEQPEVEGELGD